jgi:hypothetical protein
MAAMADDVRCREYSGSRRSTRFHHRGVARFLGRKPENISNVDARSGRWRQFRSASWGRAAYKRHARRQGGPIIRFPREAKKPIPDSEGKEGNWINS